MLAFLLMLQVVVPLSTVARGTVSSIDQPRQVVIRSAEEWSALWTAHAPRTPAPTIDFSNTMLIGVFLGTRPTGGFSVTITAVKTAGGRRTVEYVERRPDPADMVAQMLTAPFHLISVPKDPAQVEFSRTAP